MSKIISLRELRKKIMADPATKDMIRPSTKNAIFIDVDADGPADFAFICSDPKGDTLDTLAIDLSNDGDFDVYIYNCLDEEKEEIVVYPINSDVPMNVQVTAADMEDHKKGIAQVIATLCNFDGPTFAKTFQTVKATIAKDYKAGNYDVLNKSISLRELRAKIMADPATKDMIRPSTKNAIFVDVDADGPADFAFICSDPKGDTLDTFAIDLSNDGDFDVYVYNCLDEEKEEIVVYPFNSDVPMNVQVTAADMEEHKKGIAQVIATLRNFDGPTFAKTFQTVKATIAKDYKAGNYVVLNSGNE